MRDYWLPGDLLRAVGDDGTSWLVLTVHTRRIKKDKPTDFSTLADCLYTSTKDTYARRTFLEPPAFYAEHDGFDLYLVEPS